MKFKCDNVKSRRGAARMCTRRHRMRSSNSALVTKLIRKRVKSHAMARWRAWASRDLQTMRDRALVLLASRPRRKDRWISMFARFRVLTPEWRACALDCEGASKRWNLVFLFVLNAEERKRGDFVLWSHFACSKKAATRNNLNAQIQRISCLTRTQCKIVYIQSRCVRALRILCLKLRLLHVPFVANKRITILFQCFDAIAARFWFTCSSLPTETERSLRLPASNPNDWLTNNVS